MEQFVVVVKSYNDSDYRKVITDKPVGERMAARIKRGVNII